MEENGGTMKTFSAYYSIIQRIHNFTLRKAFSLVCCRGSIELQRHVFSLLLIRIQTHFVHPHRHSFDIIFAFFLSHVSPSQWVTYYAQFSPKVFVFSR